MIAGYPRQLSLHGPRSCECAELEGAEIPATPNRLQGAMMPTFEVTMSRTGGGSGTFDVVVHASTPDGARAEVQNPGFRAIAVRRVFD